MKLIEQHATEVIKVHESDFLNAVKGGKVEILEWLYQKAKEGKKKLHFGGKINLVQLFHEACSNGQVRMAEMLLKLGVKVIQRLYQTTTPLESACKSRKDNQAMVKFLLERGADINGGSIPPIQAAVEYKHTEIATMLLEHGATVPSGLLKAVVACPREDTKLVEMILQRSTRVYNDDEEDQLLRLAARWAHEKKVTILLDHGFRVM